MIDDATRAPNPWLILAGILAAIALLVAGVFIFAPGPSAPAATPIEQAPAARFDPAKVAAMKKQLLAEPEIADVLFQQPRLGVEWQVGIVAIPTDERIGPIDYARILCRQLREAGLADADTDLRLVDRIMLESRPGEFREASLAHVDCTTGDDLGV